MEKGTLQYMNFCMHLGFLFVNWTSVHFVWQENYHCHSVSPIQLEHCIAIPTVGLLFS